MPLQMQNVIFGIFMTIIPRISPSFFLRQFENAADVIPFTYEDKVIFIKHHLLEKGYSAKRLLKEFKDRSWSREGIDKLLRKIVLCWDSIPQEEINRGVN